MQKMILIPLLFSLLTALYADTLSLSADAAVALALENNLTIQGSALDLNQSERSKDAAWNAFLPDMSATAGVSNSGTLFADPEPTLMNPDPTDRSWTVNGGLSATLRLNPAVGTGIKKLRLDYEAGILSYDDARKQMKRDVLKVYYNLIATKADLALLQQNIDLAVKRYEQAQENYSNGLISELEMLQARVTAENNKPAYNSRNTGYRNQLMNFKLLLGLPGDAELELTEDLNIEYYDLDAEKLIEAYSARRLDVLQINKQIESLENTRRLTAQDKHYPWLTLSAEWGTIVADGFEGDNWKKENWSDDLTLSAMLTFPIDDFIPSSSTDVTLRNLDDQISQLQLQREQILDAAEIEITNLVMNLQDSLATIMTYALNEDLARKSFELTTEAYNLGTRELLDVEEAQTELQSASKNVLDEKFNYTTNLLDLEYALNSDDIAELLEEQ